MKNASTNSVLNVVLAAVVLVGVVFALQTIFRERELRTLQTQVVERQNNMNRVGRLLGEAVQYSTNHPDINPVLQPFIRKPGAR